MSAAIWVTGLQEEYSWCPGWLWSCMMELAMLWQLVWKISVDGGAHPMICSAILITLWMAFALCSDITIPKLYKGSYASPAALIVNQLPWWAMTVSVNTGDSWLSQVLMIHDVMLAWLKAWCDLTYLTHVSLSDLRGCSVLRCWHHYCRHVWCKSCVKGVQFICERDGGIF